MAKPLVSVIIATYCQVQTLRLQLAALRAQTCSIPFEVIVSDDGSPEQESAQAVRAVALSGIDAHYVRQYKLGNCVPRARNAGIKISSGEVLVFLDGDMVPGSEFIQGHWNIHQSASRLLIAGHRVRRSLADLPKSDDAAVVSALPHTQLTEEALIQRQVGEERKRAEYISSPFPWRAVFGCHLSVRQAEAIRFDERYKGWGPEDWAFAHRLYTHEGYEVRFQPDIVAYEVESGKGSSNVFRFGGHKEIVLLMKNVCRLAEQCPELGLELFWTFPRFALDPGSNTWSIQPMPAEYNLEQIVKYVRAWLTQYAPD